ncbi:MAG: C39 family peptidase, partial [Candidatus Uhrbacteria bacterium]|nr:C39 family peptidase [Candidatus Uhrbacteria bacterium]
ADYDAAVINNPTVAELKALIDAGKPVIIPAAGRELGNPFFSGEGPVYHMLVLRGYTEDTFITNDPGTRHGKNYSYDINVFMDAIGDWEGHDPANGAKRVIVLTPASE